VLGVSGTECGHAHHDTTVDVVVQRAELSACHGRVAAFISIGSMVDREEEEANGAPQ